MRRRIGLRLLAEQHEAAAIGDRGSRQHMHQGRFAGAVVSDQADALAPRRRQIDAVERADGAELLFDAVEPDDDLVRVGGHVRYVTRDQRSPSRKGEGSAASFPRDAAVTSCWL